MSRQKISENSTDRTEISSVSSRSSGTAGSIGSSTVDQSGRSSALGDSEMAGMSSLSVTYQSKREQEANGLGTGGAGEGQGTVRKPFSTSSSEP